MRIMYAESRAAVSVGSLGAAAACVLASLGAGPRHGLLLPIAAAAVFLAPFVGTLLGLVLGGAAAAAQVWFVPIVAVQGAGSPASLRFLQSAGIWLAAWLAGLAGDSVRRAAEDASRLSASPGAGGSLGLVSRDPGLLRLSAEIERATAYRRPLSVLLVRASLRGSLDDASATAALRGVSRAVDLAVRDTDVAIRLSGDQILVIVPETGPSAAYTRLVELDALARSAVFRRRTDRTLVAFEEVGEVRYAVRSFVRATTAEELVGSLQAERPRTGPVRPLGTPVPARAEVRTAS